MFLVRFFRDARRDASERGFTLTELLVAMAIVAVLAGISVPVIISQQGKAARAATEADLTTAFESITLAYREGRLSGQPPQQVDVDGSVVVMWMAGTTPEDFCLEATIPDTDPGLVLARTSAGVSEGACQAPLNYPDPVFPLDSNLKRLEPELSAGLTAASWDISGALPTGFRFLTSTEIVGGQETKAGSIVGPAADQWGWQGVGLAAGDAFACTVTSTQEVRCWGAGEHGQMGRGDTNASDSPVRVSLLPPTSDVTAGGAHVCALASEGGLYCWGDNTHGQVNPVSPGGDVTSPLALGSPTGVTQVAAGTAHTCTLASNGEVTCWGDNAFSQVGGTGTTLVNLPAQAQAVYAGGNYSCALVNTSLYCWGELDGVSTVTPTVINVGKPVADAAVGADHACAITTSREVYCWGDNSLGQLGSTNGAETGPRKITGITGSATGVTAGNAHTCVTASGGLFCWGSNQFGQTGNTRTLGTGQPVSNEVPGLAEPTPAAAGGNFTCSIVAGGSVECWGDAAAGQLGNGGSTEGTVSGPAVPYCTDPTLTLEQDVNGAWRCTGSITVPGYTECPSGSTLNDTVDPPQCETSQWVDPVYTCPDGGTLSGTTCTRTTSYSYGAASGSSTSTYPATSSTSTSVWSYDCPSGGTLSGTTCYLTETTAPTFDYYCAPDPNKAGLYLSGTSCHWQVWECPTGWNRIVDSQCYSTAYMESQPGYCSSIDPKPNDWWAWRYNSGNNSCEAQLIGYVATLKDRIAPADYGMTCPSGYTLSGSTCTRTTTYAATQVSVYTCPSGGTVTSASPPTCTLEETTGYWCDAAAYGYSPSLVELWNGTSPPSCRWYAWSCKLSDGVIIDKPSPVSNWTWLQADNYETSPSHCARDVRRVSPLSGTYAGTCTNARSLYWDGTGNWNCSFSNTCPSGWTDTGTQCRLASTTTSTYAASVLTAGSASYSCTTTSTKTVSVASTCSSISNKSAACGSGWTATGNYWSSPYCVISCSKTTTSSGTSGSTCSSLSSGCSGSWSCSWTPATYYCPSGGSLSGTTCTLTSTTYSYQAYGQSATWAYYPEQTMTGGGVKVLRGGFASTPIINTSTYPASGNPISVTSYSCPSGGTLSGTSCVTTSSYYYCPSGGSLSGSTCYVSSTDTYSAVLQPGTGVTDVTGTDPTVVPPVTTPVDDPAQMTPGDYHAAPSSVSGAGPLTGLPATVTVTMRDTAGNAYDKTLVLTLG